MCGRYTLATDLDEFLRALELSVAKELSHPRRYNVAPSQPVIGIVADPHPRVEIMEWGFIPSWARPERDPKPVINARVESIVEKKPYFRGAFRSGRCAILADGFYEWQRRRGGKQPFRITLRDGALFAMAGLWSTYNSGDGSERPTCAIITLRANELMKGIHDRMPAILHTAEIPHWLDPRARERDLLQMLEPFPSEELAAQPVSTLVNSPTHDSPECIEPITAPDE